MGSGCGGEGGIVPTLISYLSGTGALGARAGVVGTATVGETEYVAWVAAGGTAI